MAETEFSGTSFVMFIAFPEAAQDAARTRRKSLFPLILGASCAMGHGEK